MKGNGKVCVLGAGGFLGSTLLEQKGIRWRAMIQSGEARLDSVMAEYVVGDLLDEGSLRNAIDGCDAIVHLVSTTTPATANQDPYKNVEENVLGTIRLLDLAVETGVKTIIFASSGGTVYGIAGNTPITEDTATNPISAYGIGKLAIEHHLRLYQATHGIRCIALRMSNPYGRHQKLAGSQGVIPIFLNKALRRQCIEVWGDGSVVRDYVHADDVCRAIVLALGCDTCSGAYNVGSGRGYSIREIIDLIEDLVGYRLDVSFDDARSFDVPVNILDIDKAKRELGWRPKVGLRDGVAALMEDMRHGQAYPFAD